MEPMGREEGWIAVSHGSAILGLVDLTPTPRAPAEPWDNAGETKYLGTHKTDILPFMSLKESPD